MGTDDDSEWKPHGAALNSDGELEGVTQHLAPQAPGETATLEEQPLELVERTPSPPALIAERLGVVPLAAPRPRRIGAYIGLGLALIAAAAGVYFARRPPRQPALMDFDSKYTAPLAPDAPAPAFIRVFSQPEGAQVWVNGENVGTTPWLSDNYYGASPRVELRLAGYKPWRGQAETLRDTLAVEAKLVRGP
jgi:hypothetical protein